MANQPTTPVYRWDIHRVGWVCALRTLCRGFCFAQTDGDERERERHNINQETGLEIQQRDADLSKG